MFSSSLMTGKEYLDLLSHADGHDHTNYDLHLRTTASSWSGIPTQFFVDKAG
jgi:hypothetical protein